MNKKLCAGAAATTGALILYSRAFVNHRLPLPRAIDTGVGTLAAGAGTISYYQDAGGRGGPLALIHSINAAASAYEMRPLFEKFRTVRPVFALDLPGFGFSDRRDRVYTPALYTSAVLDFLESVGPADVVALSLSGEFCARAALERPDLFRSLALISPTGFDSRGNRRGSDLALRGFGFPLWSQAFYDLLSSRPSIRYFLRKSFTGPVDRGLEAYDYATSHQPGARFAPLYFISGKLFMPEVRDSVYEKLAIPVAVLYDRDGYVNFDRLPDFVERHKNWRAVRIPGTSGLPHFEKPRETAEALEELWAARRHSPE